MPITTQRIEFEWRISDPDEKGLYHVRERLVGNDQLANLYGPMPKHLCEPFIRARRDFVHRFVTSQALAIKVFEQRVPIIRG